MRLSMSSSSIMGVFSLYRLLFERISLKRASRQANFAGIRSASPPHIKGMNLAPLENLRGDYAGMASDWTVPQHADHYSDEDQAVWRLLVERQTALAKRHACDEFLQGLETLGIGDTIPDFDAVNARARAADRLAHRRRAGPDPRRASSTITSRIAAFR